MGALDAFVDGGERRVDLAEVNGQVFVNNVSLGLYADAVQRTGYRDAKMRTILDTVPDVLGPEGTGLDLRWTGPGGHQHGSGAAILVSNNRYRLGRAVGSGTRPSIEDGLLGITVLGAPTDREGNGRRLQRPWREWTTPAFEVAADHPVPAGIDGEATKLEPPLRFRIRPSVLRVRIAPPASRHIALGDPARELRTEPSRAGPDGHRTRTNAPTHDEGDLMDIFEVEQKERMSREEVAARLRNLADMLARHNDIEFERGGMKFKVNVPDEVDVKVELEVESDKRELEIELTW